MRGVYVTGVSVKQACSMPVRRPDWLRRLRLEGRRPDWKLRNIWNRTQFSPRSGITAAAGELAKLPTARHGHTVYASYCAYVPRPDCRPDCALVDSSRGAHRFLPPSEAGCEATPARG